MQTHSKISETKIKEILSWARYAPSSHNTQPWTVRLTANQDLAIGYESTRQLSVGDPEKRELFISLGCFIETINKAASHEGYTVDFTYKPGKDDSVGLLKFKGEAEKTKEKEWQKIIEKRRSDRRYYDKKKIMLGDLSVLEGLSCNNASIAISDSPSDIELISKLTYESTFRAMSKKEFRKELSSWVRNNWTRKPDGMPGYTQGMPGPVSLIAKFVVKNAKAVAKDQAKKDSGRILHSAAIGFVCTSQDEPQGWIDAGRLYQLACLEATKRNIKTSAISAAVIDDKTRKQITEKLKLDKKPTCLIRFGYVKGEVKASPRLSQDDFVKK